MQFSKLKITNVRIHASVGKYPNAGISFSLMLANGIGKRWNHLYLEETELREFLHRMDLAKQAELVKQAEAL